MNVIEYLESNDEETISLDELHNIMENHADSDVYSKKLLQQQLHAHYGGRMSIMSTKQQQPLSLHDPHL